MNTPRPKPKPPNPSPAPPDQLIPSVGDKILLVVSIVLTLAFAKHWQHLGGTWLGALIPALVFFAVTAFALLTNGFLILVIVDLLLERSLWLSKRLRGEQPEWLDHFHHPAIGEFSLNIDDLLERFGQLPVSLIYAACLWHTWTPEMWSFGPILAAILTILVILLFMLALPGLIIIALPGFWLLVLILALLRLAVRAWRS